MFFFLEFSFRTGGVTTPIRYFSSQRGNAVALNKVGTKPTHSSQVKPQCLGPHKEDVKRLETPHGLLPLLASEVTVFSQLEKQEDGCLLN